MGNAGKIQRKVAKMRKAVRTQPEVRVRKEMALETSIPKTQEVPGGTAALAAPLPRDSEGPLAAAHRWKIPN